MCAVNAPSVMFACDQSQRSGCSVVVKRRWTGCCVKRRGRGERSRLRKRLDKERKHRKRAVSSRRVLARLREKLCGPSRQSVRRLVSKFCQRLQLFPLPHYEQRKFQHCLKAFSNREPAVHVMVRGSMTTKTVCASEERCQRILGAVGFFLFRGVEGNDQLYRQNMQRRRAK